MRVARTVNRLGFVIAVGAWLTWAVAAFLGGRMPLLGLRTPGGVSVGLVWLVLVGPLFGLVFFIGFRLLAAIIFGIALIVLRHSHRTNRP